MTIALVAPNHSLCVLILPGVVSSRARMAAFMQPQVAGGQLVGLCGKARRDEPGRQGTHCNMWR